MRRNDWNKIDSRGFGVFTAWFRSRQRKAALFRSPDPVRQMLRGQIVLPRYLRNHSSRRNRLRNDAALLLRPPAPPANHAIANLCTSAETLRCFISVEHNDVHLADSGAKLSRHTRFSYVVRRHRLRQNPQGDN